MGRVSKAVRNPNARRSVLSALLISVVLAIALLPVASAQADTTTTTTTPTTDAEERRNV